MKEQLAAMTIIELVTTAQSYATSIQQIDTYSAIVTELANRLEALNMAHIGGMNSLSSATSTIDKLAAENVALKSGAAYFSYGSEHNFEWHKTAQAAVEAAEAAIDDYRGDACDGWSEEVDSVCWGVIMQSSTKVGERSRTEEDSCDPSIDTVCDYALLPNIETPATDAFLREQMAKGVEMFAEVCSTANNGHEIHPDIEEIKAFAAQLRAGEAA
ncbi:hypothetical protein SFA32_12525 [Buttiauxella sp. HR94]|nr:hypothetical protein SFA32_12525 [Buttiauxella sp. HR94]